MLKLHKIVELRIWGIVDLLIERFDTHYLRIQHYKTTIKLSASL
jgi:hypothetical protein